MPVIESLTWILLIQLSRAWQHTCELHGNKSSIDLKKHFMCSEGWHPSSFSKEPSLSLLHSSRALARSDELCRLYLPKQGLFLTGTRRSTATVSTACGSQQGQTCQPATGLNSLSMMRDPRWIETFSFSLAQSRELHLRRIYLWDGIKNQVYDSHFQSFQSRQQHCQQWPCVSIRQILGRRRHFLGEIKLRSLYFSADAPRNTIETWLNLAGTWKTVWKKQRGSGYLTEVHLSFLRLSALTITIGWTLLLNVRFVLLLR